MASMNPTVYRVAAAFITFCAASLVSGAARSQTPQAPQVPSPDWWRPVPTEGTTVKTVLLTMDKGPDAMGVLLRLPPGQVITVERNDGLDSCAYRFLRRAAQDKTLASPVSPAVGRELLSVYVGFHPGFLSDEAKRTLVQNGQRIPVRNGRLNGLKIRGVVWKDAEGRRFRETLVDLGPYRTPGAPPVTEEWASHLWLCFSYEGLTADESRTADALIATIRPRPLAPPAKL